MVRMIADHRSGYNPSFQKGSELKVASFLILVMSSFFAFGSTERLCGDALLSSNPVFEELVRLRSSIDDGSASDLERRARQSDYRVRMREAVKRLDIERALLVSMIEARVRGERTSSSLRTLQPETHDLAPRTTADLAEEAVIERLTLSGKRYLEFFDSTWKMRVWRDRETGLIWSDVIRDPDGKVLKVNHAEAARICAEFGGRLATKEEYEKLRADFLKPDTGKYAPQLFIGGEVLWSSSVHPDFSGYAYYFDGRGGYVRNYYLDYDHSYFAVRCVPR